VIRSFIAVDLDAAARARLSEFQERLRRILQREPIRWVRLEGIHLTLKFLGNQTAVRLEEIESLLRTHAREGEAYQLAIAGVGFFPHPGNPRVVWAGIREASGALARWAGGLDGLLASAGIEPERRPFQPHLTLGRFKDRLSPEGRRRLEAELADLESATIAESMARSVDLIRSDLRPEGPVYSVLAHVPLGSGAGS
jgi:2'-5' RNA ligase